MFFLIHEKKISYLFLDYSFLLSEAKYKANYRKSLIILTVKEMFQRLAIALTEWSEANHIFLYQAKKLIKMYAAI